MYVCIYFLGGKGVPFKLQVKNMNSKIIIRIMKTLYYIQLDEEKIFRFSLFSQHR